MPRASSKPGSATPEPLMDVLGRYKAWAATQRSAVEPAKSLDPGARELSYEEALRANRYPIRRPRSAPKPDPAGTLPLATQEAGQDRGPELKKKRVRTRLRQPCANPEINPTARMQAANPETKKRSRKADHTPKPPEFRDVLDGTVALSNTAHASVRPEKSVWLTLRVSASEQAVIQARAAEADLSVSAYLRQCAFEVESLRDQVKRALAELRAPALPGEDQRPDDSSAPKGFTGLLRRVAGMFSRQRSFSATA